MSKPKPKKAHDAAEPLLGLRVSLLPCAQKRRHGPRGLRIDVTPHGILGSLLAGLLGLPPAKAARKSPTGPKQKLAPPTSGRAFEDYPAGAKRRAKHRRTVLETYFAKVAAGEPRKTAEMEARVHWVRLTGKDCSTRVIRRWARRIRDAGGIKAAPDSAFLDAKSCRHKRQPKGPAK